MTTRTSIGIRFILNLLLIVISVWLSILVKPDTLPFVYVANQYLIISGLIATWITLSGLFRKYSLGGKRDLRRIIPAVVRVNLVIGGITALWMFGFRELEFSRFVLFGTLIIGTVLEIAFYLIVRQISDTKLIDDSLLEFVEKEEVKKGLDRLSDKSSKKSISKQKISKQSKSNVSVRIKDYIIQETDEDTFNFIANHFDLSGDDFTILSTTTRFNIVKLPEDCLNYIANLKRVNDIRYINKFFSAINLKLKEGGYYIGCVETKNMRKKRLMRKFPPIFNIFYYTLDYLLKRVAPKFNVTKKLYFFLTRGQNRVISKAETLGRLYSCGFSVVELQVINQLLFFVVKKNRKPFLDENPTYGPLIKLKRIGKGGHGFYVYKFRTMHPFSEYLQPYIYEHYNLKKGGKFENDFRITTMGRFMRKFWIDELPMLINLLKGEMKIVGVRPLSKHYFNLYNDELKVLRSSVKPGLVPPFYADMPKTLEEIQASEKKYILAYQKHSLLTDWRYFWKAFFNIVFRHARSA